jgi:hypothetical protein
MSTNEDEGLRSRARLLERWRMRQAEQSDQRALVRAEERHVQQQADALAVTSDDCARLQGEVATLQAELQALRSDVVTGLRAVRSHL